MKKFLTMAACLAAAILVCMPAYSQKKKKETARERKERIAKMVNDGASQKDIYISIFRCFNKNNNFNFNYQTIQMGNTSYYIDLKKDHISCNMPFEGLAESKSRQAYSLSNTDINIHADIALGPNAADKAIGIIIFPIPLAKLCSKLTKLRYPSWPDNEVK